MNSSRAGTSARPTPPPTRPPKVRECPVAPYDFHFGYEHYFDTSTSSTPVPVRTTRLYDAIAGAHDNQSKDTSDGTWTTPRPLLYQPRRISYSKCMRNPPRYEIPPSSPSWRPRRSSYEARRGVVGVKPSEVNMLVPHIPPIDTSLPPPSKEWLDAQAKRILAEAQADLDKSQNNVQNEAADHPKSNDDDDWYFNYDSDSTVEAAVTFPRALVPQPTSQPPLESDSSHEDDYWDVSDTDTDSDKGGDDDYRWTMTHIPEPNHLALPDISRWIHPRKRLSVDELAMASSKDPASSEDEQSAKRRRGGKSVPWRALKQIKRHASDTLTRPGRRSIIVISVSEEDNSSVPPPPPPPSSASSNAATSSHPPTPPLAPQTKLNDVDPLSSTTVEHPDPALPTKTPKVFPCLLDGCAHVCTSAGDLQRHQQSLRHRPPSYPCLACNKSYTRQDALKRHLNSKAACKKEHANKITQGPEQGENAEASTEAVSHVE